MATTPHLPTQRPNHHLNFNNEGVVLDQKAHQPAKQITRWTIINRKKGYSCIIKKKLINNLYILEVATEKYLRMPMRCPSPVKIYNYRIIVFYEYDLIDHVIQGLSLSTANLVLYLFLGSLLLMSSSLEFYMQS